MAAAEADAVAAVASLLRLPLADFNPCWMFVGDKDSLFFVDVTQGTATELPPGLHVLENRPYGAPSPKVAHVQRALRDVADARGPALRARLHEVLRDHDVPTTTQDGARLLATEANCVHTSFSVPGSEGELAYGTRSSNITLVGAAGEVDVFSCSSSPCVGEFVEVDLL